jgi:putative NADPH-quinone reductase
MPPLMKLWLDEVLAFAWAYGRRRPSAAEHQPVAGHIHR